MSSVSTSAHRMHVLRLDHDPEHARILAQAVMTSPATVVITDADGRIEYVNARFCAVTGYTAEEAIGRKASLLKSGEMPPECYRELWQQLTRGREWTGEFHNRKKNGETYWEQASISPVRDPDGTVSHYLKIAEDITRRKQLEFELRASCKALEEREAHLRTTYDQLVDTTRALKKSRQKLRRMAREDDLTGLLNRRGLYRDLPRLQALAERQGRPMGILLVDIDHFKQVNDQYGHAAGDAVLKGMASLLQSSLRASDLVCRYGGDEIVVVLPAADAATTILAAERILHAVRDHRFSRTHPDLAVTVSIGAASGKPYQTKMDDLMAQADQALYRVKQSGRNGLHFKSSRPPWDDPAASQGITPLRTSDPSPTDRTLRTMANWLDIREHATGLHCQRVQAVAGLLARTIGLSEPQIADVQQSARLHDIGKIGIPDAILLKPGPLTEAEAEIMRRHVQVGYDRLRSSPELNTASEWMRCHHEAYDGTGYPRGLKGDQIPLGARIFSLVDAYDAMRSDRPYRKGMRRNQALDEIRRQGGRQFDPGIVRVFLEHIDAVEAIGQWPAELNPDPCHPINRRGSREPDPG